MEPSVYTRFLALLIVLSLVLNPCVAVSQVGTPERPQDRMFRESQKQPTRESSLKTLSMNEKIRLFDTLSDEDKVELFKSLSDQEKALLYENISDEDKVLLFRSLKDEEKIIAFQKLSNEERIVLFSNLEGEEQAELFGSLTDHEKLTLFRKISDEEKIVLFESLNFQDKQDLLSRLSIAEIEFLKKKAPTAVTIEEERRLMPLPKPEEEELSSIEKILSGEFPTDITRELTQYGYDFFKKDITTFTPMTDVPVGADYIIGPSDNFKINLWGKVEKTYDVTVTRDGQITIPRLGTLSVSGLTFEELKEFLSRKFKEYYPDFGLSITMGRLRSIQVFVVGEAENPGTYSVSSLSTLITSLFATGGPNKNGSLRDIRLFRNGELIKEIDLYDFFLKGNKRQDVRLEPGDTLFIPVIGPVVGVAGIVRRPGIYEMRGGQTISEVIKIAGGVLPIGYLQNVVVERVEGHKRRIVKSFNIDPAAKEAQEHLQTLLSDGDVIKIYPVHKRMRKVVYLEGHVKYPREYELKPGMSVSDLISSYDALLPEPYLPHAEIIRLAPPDLHPEIVEFNLAKMLDGDTAHDPRLQDLDRVRVYSKWEKKELPEVTIKGEVQKPGTYRLYDGMTVRDLIFQAGNFTEKAYLERGRLARIVHTDGGTNMRDMEFSPRQIMFDHQAPENIRLKENDTVFIREVPEYTETLAQIVTLSGEVRFPGDYSFARGDRLNDVIQRAGGLTDEAFLLGAIFTRESVRELQNERLQEYISKLEEDVLTMSAQAASTASDSDEAAILRESIASRKELLNKLRRSEATGRMVINLEKTVADPDSEFNIALRGGDTLSVPKRSDSVLLIGEVFNPTAVLVQEGRSVDFYISRVGGMTKNASSGEVYLVKADGSVFSKRQEKFFGMFGWDHRNNRWKWGGFESIEVDPGDTIIVPKEVIKYPWFRIAKDITTIIFQVAFAAGVLVAALKD